MTLSIWYALAAGIVSFVTPCVLPLVPAYLANIAGATAIEAGAKTSRLPALFHSLFFVLGFSIVYILFGAGIGLLGSALASVSTLLMNIIAGSLLLLFGIYILAALKVPWLNYESKLQFNAGQSTGYVRSVIIGGVFALGWSPCTGPFVLAVGLMAMNTHNIAGGAVLLIFYSIGLGIPFVLLGVLWGFIMPFWKSINKYLGLISLISGILLVIFGILFLTQWINEIRGFLGQFIHFEGL